MYFLFTLCVLCVSTEIAGYVSVVSGRFLDVTRLPKHIHQKYNYRRYSSACIIL